MKESLLFLGQTLRHWRTTGAITQSGPALSRAIAESAGEIEEGKVILELGPGTGVVTRELIKRYPRNRIVAVEVIDVLAARLKENLPGITVVVGCASELPEHLARLGINPADVAAVVSGLPLLSLPGDLPQRIHGAITDVLKPGRRYVQFTYSERAWRRFHLEGFRRHSRQRVWMNIPPAVVLTFVRNS